MRPAIPTFPLALIFAALAPAPDAGAQQVPCNPAVEICIPL